jgi:hypothetical protein
VTQGLSPARLAEAAATLAHFEAEPRAAVLAQLGYDEGAFDQAASLAKEALVAAVAADQWAPVLAFARAYEATLGRLRARRPRLGGVKPDPALEPILGGRVVAAPPAMVALPAKQAPAPEPIEVPLAVPSYLHEADERRPSGGAASSGAVAKESVEAASSAGSFAAAAPAARPASPEAPAGSGTADITSLVPRDALPFVHGAGTAGPPAVATPAPASPEAPAGSGTEDISAFVPRGAMPFAQSAAAAPQDAAAAHPRLRLIRFDPQTGQPLAEPRWVEIPPEPQGGTPGKR